MVMKMRSLYLVYMGTKLEERAGSMLNILINANYYNINLERIMQMGDGDLPEFDKFIPLWIDELSEINSRTVERLMEEAVRLCPDANVMLQNARKYITTNPSLFEQYLISQIGNIDDRILLKNAIEAIESIPVKFKVRGNIALIAAKLAFNLGEENLAQKQWLTAFSSCTEVTNFLRIRFLKNDWEEWAQTVDNIVTKQRKDNHSNTHSYMASSTGINSLTDEDYFEILFWKGDFETLIKEGMKVKNGIGWSSSFMKEGLAFLLLFLYKGEVDDNPAGLTRMRLDTLSRGNYGEIYEGTNILPKDDEHAFYYLLDKYKNEKTLSYDEIGLLLNNIDRWLQKRVEAITSNQRRNYYYECAAFIAAFGEVKESLGYKNAKQLEMLKYKIKYSRYRSFMQALKGFGMAST